MHLIISLHIIKMYRHNFKEWGSKKNNMNLYFYDRAFLQKYFTAKSFIVHIRPAMAHKVSGANSSLHVK